MRVAVYHSNSDVRIEERPVPTIGPGELLLRVESSGICGSDVMEWYRVPRAPLVLGHEVAGVVEAVGDGVSAFAAGDRIATTHHVPCMDCVYCHSDRHSVCETLQTTHFDPGGFAEFVRLPAINVERGTFVLPDAVGFDEGTFVEPLACVVRGQRLAGVRAGDTVVVLGSGISGLLQVQLARAAGAARVLTTDVSDYRLKLAASFGAETIRADGDVAARVRAATGGRLADRVLVCTGARAAFEQALGLVDRGGTILFFAPLPPGEDLALPVNALWRQGVSIVHSYAGPPAEMRQALALIAAGSVDVASMITHRLPLSRTQDGFQLLVRAQDSMKVIVKPQQEGRMS